MNLYLINKKEFIGMYRWLSRGIYDCGVYKNFVSSVSLATTKTYTMKQ